MAVAPMAAARGGASGTPPAALTCAPSRSSVAMMLLAEVEAAAAQHPSAARTMDVARLGERVVVRAAALALRLEPFVAAADAELVVRIVGAKAATHGAALGDRFHQRLPRSQLSGSTARPLGRISKWRCGLRSGSL